MKKRKRRKMKCCGELQYVVTKTKTNMSERGGRPRVEAGVDI